VDNATESCEMAVQMPEASDLTAPRTRIGKFGGVRVRVLIPLTVALVVVLGGFGWSSYASQIRKSRDTCGVLRKGVSQAFQTELAQEAGTMVAALEAIAWNQELRTDMLEGNTEALYERAKPLFDRMREQNRITHFYFLNPQRECLLRVHQPKRRGDKIERFSAKEAERTGKIAQGIELGPLGTFTLRVVRPWYDNGRLIGYIEMGEEIEHITEHLSKAFDVEICILIKKQLLDQAALTEGMAMLGRQSDWDRLPTSVVVSHTMGDVPDALSESMAGGDNGDPFDFQTNISGRNYAVCSFELLDASGRDVGDLLVV
jgi:hypothetical protein